MNKLKINKSLKAFLKGYILFRVNDELFLLYNSAKKRRVEYAETNSPVNFNGYHIIRGWTCFFIGTGKIDLSWGKHG